jgi:WD40 repeat protein/serine/threonine protein kinase
MTTPVSPIPPVSEEELAARLAAQKESRLRSTDQEASSDIDAENADSEVAARISRSQGILRLLDRVWRRGATSDSNTPAPEDQTDGERVTAALSGQIGRFDLVRELGRGGFGIVFLAVDPVLGRTVALKVPRPEVLVTPELRDRFLREAQAAAVLSHPNLVQVYEAGEIGPICYIVSAYCPGKTLHEWLAEKKGPAAPRTAASIIALIAGAVQHAHDRGILHRDLKPANILLESLPPGEPAGQENSMSELSYVPKLTDFGLAKLLEQETTDNATPMSAIIGTPAYMSPEQADGGSSQIGPAADVYSLGAVLYELLTGAPPFRGSNDRSVIAQLLTEEVRPPRRLCRAVPPDLEAICLKCLEKRPEKRYKSAAALATDLQCFLAGIPTQARPLGPGGRLVKWSRRKPATATLLGICLASLLVSPLAYDWHRRNLQSAVDRAEQERTAVEQLRVAAAQRESEFRRRYYVAGLKLAYAAYKSADVQQAVQFLEQQRSLEGQEELRGFVWHYLWHLCHGNPITLSKEDGPPPQFVAFSLDGRIFGVAGQDGVISLWDMPGHKLRARLRGHSGRVNAIAFSPDGETLASCGADRTVRLWSLSSGNQLSVLSADAPETLALVFSHDGRSLATAGKEANIELWDTTAWKKRGELEGRAGAAGLLSWSADGRLLASGAGHSVKVWELEKPARPRYELTHDAPVTCVAFSNDSRTLVSSSLSPIVKLWDVAAGKLLFDLAGHTSEINFVQFSSDDRQLATAGRSGVMRIWDVKARTQTRYVQAHAGPTVCLAMSPFDRSLVTTGIEGKEGDEGAVKFWDFTTWSDTTTLTPPLVRVEAMSFCAKGRTLACGDANGALHWYDVPSGTLRRMNHEHSSRIVKLAGSADGSHLASASDDGTVRIWDPATGAVRSVLTGHANGALSVAFSADSQLLASGAADGKVRIWHANTGQLVQELHQYPERVHALAFAPEGRRLAVGHGRVLSVWGLEESESVVERDLEGAEATIEMTAWSLDKPAVAVVDALGRAYEWTESSTTAKSPLARRDADERALIFGNRGGGIITGDSEGNFSFWSFVSEQIVITLTGHGGPVTNAAFSLDGRTVATYGADQQGRPQLFLWLSGMDPQ